ncbi:hypothetical protein D3C87_1632290 [compost metagenome]
MITQFGQGHGAHGRKLDVVSDTDQRQQSDNQPQRCLRTDKCHAANQPPLSQGVPTEHRTITETPNHPAHKRLGGHTGQGQRDHAHPRYRGRMAQAHLHHQRRQKRHRPTAQTRHQGAADTDGKTAQAKQRQSKKRVFAA